MPLAHKEDIWSVDEMDSAEIVVPDAPHADEILIALAFGVGAVPATAPLSADHRDLVMTVFEQLSHSSTADKKN
jgi:amino acid synthesis protein